MLTALSHDLLMSRELAHAVRALPRPKAKPAANLNKMYYPTCNWLFNPCRARWGALGVSRLRVTNRNTVKGQTCDPEMPFDSA